MKRQIKYPYKLERSLDNVFSNTPHNLPVIVLDTGALIDIVHASRNYDLTFKGDKARNEIYANPVLFLMSLNDKAPFVIPPLVMDEVESHGRCKLNSYRFELSDDVLGFTRGLFLDSKNFLKTLESELELDEVGLDSYLISHVCCDESPKKKLEGVSRTDRQVISTAAYLATSHLKGYFYRKVNPVVILSSDAHCSLGTNFINQDIELRTKYPGINCVSTRLT